MRNQQNEGVPVTADINASGQFVLPFYIVCDESYSMQAIGGIDAINLGLPELHSAIAADPLVNDKCRISIITFSDTAEVVLPLTRMADVTALPQVESRATTNYGAAFDLLHHQIPIDIASLKSNGLQVHRPAVFFISDGEPTDTDWQDSYRRLVDQSNAYRPNIVAFGVNGAEASTIGKVATVQAFLAESHINPGMALREIMRSLTNSIVQSSGSSTPSFVVPPPPDGIVVVPLDPV
jgi:uncharacterized protein YegL